MLLRVQLIVPENTAIQPQIFDRIMSTFGVTAVVLFAIPLALGLISYVVPLQIGSRGVAFPRLNLLSFWLYLVGAATIYGSFLYRPSEAGFAALPPLSENVFLNTRGVDAWIVGTALAVLGFVCFSVNLVVTLHNMRAPGMAWRRVPLFTWAAGISGYLLLVIGPVMLAALTMLFIDRHYGGVFFNAGEGGAPLLYEHLAWFFFTGVYMLVLVFAAGVISDILPTFARKPLFSHRAAMLSHARDRRLGPARLDAEHVHGPDRVQLRDLRDGVRARAHGPGRAADLQLDRHPVGRDAPHAGGPAVRDRGDQRPERGARAASSPAR